MIERKNQKELNHHPTNNKTNNENQEEKSETKRYTNRAGWKKRRRRCTWPIGPRGLSVYVTGQTDIPSRID